MTDKPEPQTTAQEAASIVALEAERAFKVLKPLNKALARAERRADKDAIGAEMDAIKVAWFKAVAPTLANRHQQLQAAQCRLSSGMGET